MRRRNEVQREIAFVPLLQKMRGWYDCIVGRYEKTVPGK
jgi:hypothetical protein